MIKVVVKIFIVLFSISAVGQTLDNTLGTEDRKDKKFGWIAEGPGGYEFFYVGGKRYSGDFNFNDEEKRLLIKAKFKNGSYHGVVVEYFKDGSVKSKGKYRNGAKVGKWIYNYDHNSFEEKVYSRRLPNEVRKSFFINSNGVLMESYHALRNMRFTKKHFEYHENGNIKMRKELVSRFKKIYEIQEYYISTKLAKHYFLKFDKEKEEWLYINEYKEYNKNGKLLIHEYH